MISAMRSDRYARTLTAITMALYASSHPAAQQSAASRGTSETTGSISGSVVSAASGIAIPRARVSLTSGALSAPRVVLTDAGGLFHFRELPAGAYALTVMRTGYVPQRFGQTGAAGPVTAPIQLQAAAQLSGVAIPLSPGGVIAGRLLDEDGAPLAGATVEAQARRLDAGRQTLETVATAQTDDRGEFRLAGLASGSYYVRAFDPAFANAGDETGLLRYAPTYHPGVVVPQAARPVTVAPGKESGRVEFKLQFVRPAAVSGRLVTADGRRLATGAVIMIGAGDMATAAIPPDDVMLYPDGRFSFRNVPPGRYVLRGRGETERGGLTLFATYLIVVEGRSVDGVVLQLVRGGTFEGVLEIAPRARARRLRAPPTLRVRAPFIDGTSFGDAVSGDVDAAGRFQIRGLMPGLHAIVLDGLVEPWTLERVMVRGRDVTDIALDVQSGEHVGAVRLVVSETAARVAGTVRDRHGTPAAGAAVIACTETPTYWTRGSRRLRVLQSGFDGRYEIEGLPPGNYRVIAVAGLDEAETFRPEVLQKIIPVAAPVTLGPGTVRTLDLPLIYAPGPAGFSR
jgi:carboxypeptidase family protein